LKIELVIPNFLRDYYSKDVFNINETGLFYKLLPNRTLQFKGERCHGGSFIYSSAFTIYGAGYYSSSLFEPFNPVVVGGEVSVAKANG
jgi:hypothetical protein